MLLFGIFGIWCEDFVHANNKYCNGVSNPSIVFNNCTDEAWCCVNSRVTDKPLAKKGILCSRFLNDHEWHGTYFRIGYTQSARILHWCVDPINTTGPPQRTPIRSPQKTKPQRTPIITRTFLPTPQRTPKQTLITIAHRNNECIKPLILIISAGLQYSFDK